MSFLVERAFGEVVAGSIMWFTFSDMNNSHLGYSSADGNTPHGTDSKPARLVYIGSLVLPDTFRGIKVS
jgi:hypothetical protein